MNYEKTNLGNQRRILRESVSEAGTETPTHLDLFSGIGGFALAAQWAGFRTIGFCEIDPYCQRILAKNFGAQIVADTASKRLKQHGELYGNPPQSEFKTSLGNDAGGCNPSLADPERDGLDGAQEPAGVGGGQDPRRVLQSEGSGYPPIFIPDIRDLDGRDFAGVTLVTGGFPCQPFSVAGQRRGKDDDRAIWPQMFRVISEARPAWVLGENVAGIIPMELDRVLSDLEGIGYATRTFVVPACAVDAPHRRMRVWIVGHSPRDEQRGIRRTRFGTESAGETQQTRGTGENHCDQQGSQGRDGTELLPERAGQRTSVADAAGERCQRRRGSRRWRDGSPDDNGREWCQWQPEPAMGQLVDGLPDGLVRYAGRVATRIPNRVQKLKALGNSIVPQVAYPFLKAIYESIDL